MDYTLESSIANYDTRVRKIDKISAFSILFMIALILIDSFLLPPVWKEEVCTDGNVETTHPSESVRDEYNTYLIITKAGHHFMVPQRVYYGIDPGQSFDVGQSRLLKRPLRIHWKEEGYDSLEMNIGILNTIPRVCFVTLGISFLSVVIFLVRLRRPTRGITTRMYVGLVICCFIFLMYLTQPWV
jgi:hypothetical protein